MRTGREDVFTFAEKLSRHASEVDVYHMGKYKGLGSFSEKVNTSSLPVRRK